MEIYKSYNKNFGYSYCFGAFPVIELINFHPEIVLKVFISSSFKQSPDNINIFEICKCKNISIEINDKIFDRLSPKDNCFVIGVFKKYSAMLDIDSSHVVLVNPSNAGNLGTIIRTMVGFEINNLAIVRPGVDIFEPKVIRASMGALFKIKFKYYERFSDYKDCFRDHKMYTFMLNGKSSMKHVKHNSDKRFSLIFGNEACGLPADYLNIGNSIVINHSHQIDSLALPIAFGIGAYEFYKNNKGEV